MTRAEIDQWAEELDIELIVADGFDDAFIGIDLDWECPRAVYSREKAIEILERDMTYEEAVEYFDFNVSEAYVGPGTPMFITTLPNA